MCRHKKLSFPITLPKIFAKGKETYVVCLDCGKKFRYDWEKMKVLKGEEVLEVA